MRICSRTGISVAERNLAPLPADEGASLVDKLAPGYLGDDVCISAKGAADRYR